MNMLSCSNSNEYEDVTKYRTSGIYAEVGDKEYEAVLSAKIASMEDYVPMASISGSLGNLNRADYPPTVAPPTYSVDPPIYSIVVPTARNESRDLDPPIYTQEVGGDSPVYTIVGATDAQSPTHHDVSSQSPTRHDVSSQNPTHHDVSSQDASVDDIIPANGDTVPAAQTSQDADIIITAPPDNDTDSSTPITLIPVSNSPGIASNVAASVTSMDHPQQKM